MNICTPTVSITSLPNELLALIAAAGQSRVPSSLPDREPSSEWTLSHVSHRLRGVMIGSPTLWTVVEVDLNFEGSVEILGLYLERSQDFPLAVAFQHRSGLLPGAVPELVIKRLSRIVLHINRISWLRIVPLDRPGDALFAPFRDLAAPALQHLEVVNMSHSRSSQWAPIELFSAGAPRIRFLRVYGRKLQWPAPWASSLTHLELRRYHNFDQVVVHCPSLIYLYLDMEWVPLDRRVHIPSLRSLYITSSGTFHLMRIPGIFDTPSLNELTIMGVHGIEIFEFFGSTSFPRAFFPALASLCFLNNEQMDYCERHDTIPQTPCAPFRLFPALSSLSLIDVCFTSHIVKAIAPTSATCPVLQTIALSPKTAATEDVRSAVLDAIHSYLQYGRPLPTLRLSPALASCEGWQKHGLGIAVEKFDPTDVLQVCLASDLQYA
ncbi:hypothetical protein C8R45DRAFT_987137 [Mycena sanguinolenta]|nr:hypothetical protein C8R45DRAFT_987137 [Mycena sanguinolenta]